MASPCYLSNMEQMLCMCQGKMEMLRAIGLSEERVFFFSEGGAGPETGCAAYSVAAPSLWLVAHSAEGVRGSCHSSHSHLPPPPRFPLSRGEPGDAVSLACIIHDLPPTHVSHAHAGRYFPMTAAAAAVHSFSPPSSSSVVS